MGKTETGCVIRATASRRWALLLVPALLQLAACGTVNYSTQRENFLSDSSQEQGTRTLGNVYVNFSDSEFARPYTMEFNRVRESRDFDGENKGYAFNAPIFDNHHDTRVHYTVSKTKDYKWFSGLQMKWTF